MDCRLAIVGDGSMFDKSKDCTERREDGRSDGVRGEPSDGVRDEGSIGTLLNPSTSVMDCDGRGLTSTSLAVGIGRVRDENINISGWVAVEIGR